MGLLGVGMIGALHLIAMLALPAWRSPPDVLGWGHRLEVVWVDARLVATQVVEVKTGRDGTDEDLPHEAMRQLAPIAEVPVAISIDAARPTPAVAHLDPIDDAEAGSWLPL
jgi:hypothetical protein